jgi:hypothetical protein
LRCDWTCLYSGPAITKHGGGKAITWRVSIVQWSIKIPKEVVFLLAILWEMLSSTALLIMGNLGKWCIHFECPQI